MTHLEMQAAADNIAVATEVLDELWDLAVAQIFNIAGEVNRIADHFYEETGGDKRRTFLRLRDFVESHAVDKQLAAACHCVFLCVGEPEDKESARSMLMHMLRLVCEDAQRATCGEEERVAEEG